MAHTTAQAGKPNTKSLGYKLGMERAQVDQQAGNCTDPDNAWVPANASAEYERDLRAGYRDYVNGTQPCALDLC